MTKKNFTKALKIFDEYYNGKISDALTILGIYENKLTQFMDEFIDIVAETLDPQNKAEDDDLTYNCGCYICEWLLGNDGLRDRYPTPEALYDYITAQYKEVNE